jgi:hypothetical protein
LTGIYCFLLWESTVVGRRGRHDVSETSPAPWKWVPAGFAAGEIRDAEGGLVAAGVAKRDGPLVEAAPDLVEALQNLVASIERAAAAGIDLTGHVGVGEALRALDKTKGRAP